MDVKEKGAYPIVLSHTPRNKWDNGQIERNTNSFGAWTRQAAEEAGAWFIDLNKITADKLQDMGFNEGLRVVGEYFKRVQNHTSFYGSRFYSQIIVLGGFQILCPLKNYIK